MKKILHSLLIAVFLFTSLNSFAQKIQYCDVDNTHLGKLKSDSAYRLKYEKLERKMKKMKPSGLKAAVNGVYYVPVVFHIITNSSNITGAFSSAEYELYSQYQGSGWSRTQDQLDRLNEEFLAANIQFCLAQNAPPSFEGVTGIPGSWQEITLPSGSSITSTGVTYTIDDDLSTFQSSDQTEVTYLESILPFNQAGENYYLDIYVVDNVLSPNNTPLSGEAPYGLGSFFDDITVRSTNIGNVLSSNYNGGYTLGGNDHGKVAVHEVGHWLLLRHVFADDQWCGAATGLTGDGIDDTPPQSYPPPAGINSFTLYPACNFNQVLTPTLTYNNHMDYVDDDWKVAELAGGAWVHPFTPDQNTHMATFISNSRGAWHSTLNRINTGIESAGCIPGHIPQVFTAEFDMDQTVVCAGDNIGFIGMAVSQLPPGASIVNWTFTITDITGEVAPQTVFNQGNNNVSALFTTGSPGTYSIMLNILYNDNGNFGNVSYTHPINILVEDCSASPIRFIKSFDYASSSLTDLSIVSTSGNDGYIISGTNNITQNQKRIVVFKVDLLGEIIWEWEFQDPNGDNARSFDIIQKNGSPSVYVISGYSTSSNGNKEALVLEIIDQGTTCIQSSIGALQFPIQFFDPVANTTLYNSIAVEIINTSDGGFAIAGVVATGFDEADPKNQLLIKLDNSLGIEWIEQYNFSQSGDNKDFDFANSVVELTNYNSNTNQFEAAYFLGGGKNKRVASVVEQGVSSIVIEDAGGIRYADNNNISWGTGGNSPDYGMDVIYNPQEDIIYQKAFTKKTHGLLIVKIDPYTGGITEFFESNLLEYGEEYLGLKMIESNNGQDLVMTGQTPGNGINPTAMKLSKSGWAQMGVTGSATINNLLFREYEVNVAIPSSAGPDFPVTPSNFGSKHFFYSPKSICRSPNGGYMYVQSGKVNPNSGSSLNLLKLDEGLKIGCGSFTTMEPENLFSPIPINDLLDQSGLTTSQYSSNLNDVQNTSNDCSDFCFGDFIVDACDNDEDGFAEFDLEAIMADFSSNGYTYNWFTDNSMTTPINNPANHLASDGDLVYLFIETPDLCSTTATVTLVFTDPPVANGTFSVQASLNGTFNLEVAQLQNIGTGYTVEWYIDPSLTQLIVDPQAYQGVLGATVYAKVTGSSCEWTIPVRLSGCSDLSERWPKHSVSQGNDEYATDIVSDQNGNYYMTGMFGGTLEFMGVTVTETAVTDENFFIAKFNECSLEWIKIDDGAGLSKGTGIDVDASGNVYVSGQYKDAIDLGNSVQLSTTGDYEGFVAKYSSSGIAQWIQPLEPSNNNYSHAHDVAVDQASGSVYVTGFQQDITNQYMLVKYSSSGLLQWTITDAFGPNNYGWSVDVDQQGNVVMAGVVQGIGTVNLDGQLLTTTVANQTMIAKFNSSGNIQNIAQNSLEVGDVKVDPSGNVFVLGSHDGSNFLFNGLTYNGVIILTKYNSALVEDWARVGTSSIPQAYPIVHIGSRLSISPAGDIFIAGSYKNNLTFGALPTITTQNILALDVNNYFTVKYNTNGNEQWVTTATSNLSAEHHPPNSPDYGFPYPPLSVCITHDGNNNAYLASRFSETMTLGNNSITSVWTSNIFMAEINDLGNSGVFTRKKNPAEFGNADDFTVDIIQVFPNPSNGTFQIKWDQETTEVISYRIISMQGQEVAKSMVNGLFNLNLSDLSNGIYYLTLETTHGPVYKKLLLNK